MDADEKDLPTEYDGIPYSSITQKLVELLGGEPEHEATLMNILCAPTGSGKESITQPINHIMADIRLRDAEQRERERLWKYECNRKSSNKDKRERPEGLVIQEVNIDMTNPAFVLRMKEAENHFLYAKVNELNLFDALKGKTNQHFRIMELAFDLGNYGQDRVGVQSVTETVKVRFNWNACCTPKKCRDYFRRVVTDGPVSRISFATIERRPCGSAMPIYGTYDAAFDEELKPYIDCLVKARGLVDCPQDTGQDRHSRKLLPRARRPVAPIQGVASPLARRAWFRGHPHPRRQLSRRYAGLHPRGREQDEGHGGELPPMAAAAHPAHHRG